MRVEMFNVSLCSVGPVRATDKRRDPQKFYTSSTFLPFCVTHDPNSYEPFRVNAATGALRDAHALALPRSPFGFSISAGRDARTRVHVYVRVLY